LFNLNQVEYCYGSNRALFVDSWSAAQGEHCLLIGPSGSGKTTLLHLLAGIIRPQKGELTVLSRALTSKAARDIDRFRGTNIGIVFQRLYLVDALSVLDNLLLAPYCAGQSVATRRDAARELLSRLGLEEKVFSSPRDLSQGQAQRVAIARAVMNKPQLILADEPTSSLDDRNCAIVAELLETQAQNFGATLVISTHDNRLRTSFSNKLEL